MFGKKPLIALLLKSGFEPIKVIGEPEPKEKTNKLNKYISIVAKKCEPKIQWIQEDLKGLKIKREAAFKKIGARGTRWFRRK